MSFYNRHYSRDSKAITSAIERGQITEEDASTILEFILENSSHGPIGPFLALLPLGAKRGREKTPSFREGMIATPLFSASLATQEKYVPD